MSYNPNIGDFLENPQNNVKHGGNSCYGANMLKYDTINYEVHSCILHVTVQNLEVALVAPLNNQDSSSPA
jgi:hypothetical protein